MKGTTRQRGRQPIGAHMSIAGGMQRAIERAAAVDATALQVFVKSARQWTARPLTAGMVTRFRQALERSRLAPNTLAHASYLINLASPEAELRRRSVAALREEIERCRRLGIAKLVLHPGSHVGSGEGEGLRRVVDGIDRVLAPRRGTPRRGATAPQVRVLVENTAGQGTNLGHRFEHLGFILRRARSSPRLGVCFDTCHALAAGYEFRDRRSYRAMLREFDAAVGVARLGAFHLNDSAHALGSRRDRHAHVGRGQLGLEPFRLILGDRRFRGLPMVLETPKGPDLAEDLENLGVLRAMLPGSRR